MGVVARGAGGTRSRTSTGEKVVASRAPMPKTITQHWRARPNSGSGAACMQRQCTKRPPVQHRHGAAASLPGRKG